MCDRRGTIRRYMTEDVIKQAATEDDDAYNESLQTNTRLMVSPYSGSTLNYMPHHQQYQHHQQLQHLGVASTPAADKRWLDVTTIVGISADDDGSAGYTISCVGDRHGVPAAVDDGSVLTCSSPRPPVCATHMYESPRFQ